MKYLIITLKVVINILILAFYSFIGIILGNFVYGLILSIFDKAVPGTNDPVHMKLAVLVVIFITIITLINRKFFYITICNEENNTCKIEKKDEIKNIPTKKVEEKKEEKDEELKIYIDKEIK